MTQLFRKSKDKVASEEEPEARRIEPENEENKTQTVAGEEKEGLVYAELDLVSPNTKPIVKTENEKTEYAEIVYPTEKNDDTK